MSCKRDNALPLHRDEGKQVAIQSPPYANKKAIPSPEQFNSLNSNPYQHGTTPTTAQVTSQNNPYQHGTTPITAQVTSQNIPRYIALPDNALLSHDTDATMPIIGPSPDTFLFLAVLACLCFCPLGILAICKSEKCSLAAREGKINEARRLSSFTKVFAGFSIVIGGFMYVYIFKKMYLA